MTGKNVKVAVIGCGRIAGHHCRTIVTTPGLELAAVCDLQLDRAKAYSEECKVPAYQSYHEMFRAISDIDIVAIATPSGMHYEHSTEIMKRYGKHLVVEKPTFMKPSQLESAYRLASDLKLQIFPVFQNRYNKAVVRVKKALDSGELGAIRTAGVRVRWCRPQRYYNLAPWRGTFAQDGGCLTNQGIHHIDLLRYLGGELATVSCVMRTLGAEIEVEDTVVANFTYKTGAVGSLEVTTAARPDDFEASLSFVCEKGLVQLGGIAVNELQIFTPDPLHCKEHSEDFSGCVYGNGHGVLYANLSRCFHHNEPYPIAKDDALRSIQLLHTFYCSAAEGTRIEVSGNSECERLGEPNEELARCIAPLSP